MNIPYTNHEVAIRKDGNIIEVSNERGLRVSCDPHLEVCSVILDGWLHGKIISNKMLLKLSRQFYHVLRALMVYAILI